MTTDIRVALEQLIKETEYLAKGGEDLDRAWAGINAARDALKEDPDGEGPKTHPSQQQIDDLLVAISAAYSAQGWVPNADFICLFEEVARLAGIVEEGWDASVDPDDIKAKARAVLSRWGRSVTPPAPVPLHGYLQGYEAGRRDAAADAQQAAEAAQNPPSWPPCGVPVAVSDGPPKEGDCDAEGRCWCFTPRMNYEGMLVMHSRWILSRPADVDTHWLPHNAIPLPAPQFGEVQL